MVTQSRANSMAQACQLLQSSFASMPGVFESKLFNLEPFIGLFNLDKPVKLNLNLNLVIHPAHNLFNLVTKHAFGNLAKIC